jgi:hypothetical protein
LVKVQRANDIDIPVDIYSWESFDLLGLSRNAKKGARVGERNGETREVTR